MIYALKSALLLTLFYGGFAALLSRETYHRFNRVVLISIMLLSMVLPAIRLQIAAPKASPMSEDSNIFRPFFQEPSSTVPLTFQKETVGASEPVVDKSVDMNPAVFYLVGVIAFLFRFVWRCVQLVHGLRGGLRISDEQGNTVIVKGGEFAPYSFMHYIVISIGDYENHRRHILTHEQAHARLGHSWDVLLIELVQVVQWFNPFAWLLGRELKTIHEYEADEAVICQGIDAKQYQQLLVIKAVGNRLQPFANTLNRGSLKQRINMMYQKKSNPWSRLRAAFVLPIVAVALYAFAEEKVAPSPSVLQIAEGSSETAEQALPLVEYKTHQKWGKGYRDYYIVNLPKGVWIEQGDKSFIEEQYFRWSFDNTQGKSHTVMMLNGKTFDQNSLPQLSNAALKKIEIRQAERTIVEGSQHGTKLDISGRQQTVNLVTTAVTIPASVKGNVPREQTLLLPGNGELYIKNGKAEPGDWMHSSVTSWEKTSYGYSVRNEFELPKTMPGYKCYIYASTETAEKDISRAERLMKELGIGNYEVVRGLPKRHFTDSELRQWAIDQKAKGTAFKDLFDAMAPNHMDCADVHRQWHIVKAVYGKK